MSSSTEFPTADFKLVSLRGIMFIAFVTKNIDMMLVFCVFL